MQRTPCPHGIHLLEGFYFGQATAWFCGVGIHQALGHTAGCWEHSFEFTPTQKETNSNALRSFFKANHNGVRGGELHSQTSCLFQGKMLILMTAKFLNAVLSSVSGWGGATKVLLACLLNLKPSFLQKSNIHKKNIFHTMLAENICEGWKRTCVYFSQATRWIMKSIWLRLELSQPLSRADQHIFLFP